MVHASPHEITNLKKSVYSSANVIVFICYVSFFFFLAIVRDQIAFDVFIGTCTREKISGRGQYSV